MRNKILTLGILFGLTMMYPWSCSPQGGVPITDGEDCDTIYVESPVLDAKIEGLNTMIARLTEENIQATNQNNGLKKQLEECNNTVASQQSTIATQKATILSLEATITELENRPPEIVTDTIYKEADFITVNGVEYKVADIELIKPLTETVEWEMFFCYDTLASGQQTTGKRPFIHEGDINTYPHYVNVASKDRGMIKVWFETPLDSTIKVAKSWILDERRDYKNAKTRYTFKSHTKF